jgi:hypothetical protein
MRMAMGCTFARRSGSTISGRTIDLGPGGMCVATTRPLSVDEVLDFELPESDGPLMGEVRVMREQAFGVYAVRFERLGGSAQNHLRELCATAMPGMATGTMTPDDGRALENGEGVRG